MIKHVQTRTQLLITHISDAIRKTSMPINLIAARRQANWTKVYADGLFSVRKNDIRVNDVSGKRRSAERRFVKMTFGWKAIRENDVRLNNDSEKCRSALWNSANSTIRPCDDSVQWLLAIFRFGKITIRQNWISAKQRFDEMTFRENDVAQKKITRKLSLWISRKLKIGEKCFFSHLAAA